MPRNIGLITSGTGAALHDVLNALARRWPLAAVQLYPVPVQGKEAPPAIIRALRELPQRAPVDVILLVRGGGSLEDLWAFNDEAVARAIRACAVPVVSGVGHEIDFTIADFAADLRAATPTAAAELATPDIAEASARIAALRRFLSDLQSRRLLSAVDNLKRAADRLHLLHPGRRLQERAQRLDELDERLRYVLQARLAGRRDRVLAQLQGLRLRGARLVDEPASRLRIADALLKNLNPNAVLERGYALALNPDGSLIRDAAGLMPGDAIRVRLARGGVAAEVKTVDSR